jgi:hypothetical protein
MAWQRAMHQNAQTICCNQMRTLTCSVGLRAC